MTLLLVCLICFNRRFLLFSYNHRASQFFILGLQFHEYRDINNESSKVSKHEQLNLLILSIGSSLLNMACLFLSPVKSLLFFGGHFWAFSFLLLSSSWQLLFNAISQRFFPSEFGNDVDRAHLVEAAKPILVEKVQFRRTVEASGVPYTFVACNWFAGYFLPTLAQAGASGLPVDKVTILGDGNVKGKRIKSTHLRGFSGNTGKAPISVRTINRIGIL